MSADLLRESEVPQQPLRPAFPFYGGKVRLAADIVNLFPPHRVYVEPYAGSAAVLLAKPPSKHEVLNDLDGNVVAFYRAMRDTPQVLRRALTLTPYSREEYDAADLNEPGLSTVERARRFVIRAGQSINAAGAAGSPGWALSTTRNQSRPGTFAGAVDRLPAIAERLRRVYIEHHDALGVIARHGASSDAVLYVDPPYLASTRRSLNRAAYRLDAHTPEEHADTLAALNRCAAHVVLSGYDSAQYDSALSSWRRVEVSIGKPSANRSGVKQSAAVEVLWIKEASRG